MNEQLKIIISAEIGKLKDNLDKAKSEVKGFSKQFEEAKKNVDEQMKNAGQSISTGLKGAAIGITAASGALLALGASTAEYRNEQAKLVTAFESAGSSAETAKETYNDLYRVLGDGGQATEAASHLAKLTTEEQALSEWTNICQGVYATFGASLPIEGLTEAANETAKVGQVTGGLADALNWAGISEDEFNEKLAACNTEAEREKLIRETLNGVYSDAAAKYEENNAGVLAQNEAQAKLEATTAKLGEALAPVITAFTELAGEALAELTPYIQDLAEKLMPVLGEVLGVVAEALSKSLGFLAEHWELLVTIGGIIGGIVTAIGLYNTVAAIKAAMDAAQVTTIWGLVAAHIAQAAAAMVALAPYLLIVAAIAAVIAIIVLCIKYWDDIVAAVKKAMNAIWNAIKSAVDWIKGIVDKIINFVKDNWQGLLLLLVNPFAGAFKLIYDNCEGFREMIDGVVEKIKGFFSGLWNSIKNGAKAAWDGIKNVFSTVADFFKNIFSKAWEGVKKVFSVGGKVFDGIKDGIVKAFNTVVNAIIKGINKVVKLPFEGLNTVLNKISGLSIAGIKPFSWLTWRAPVPQIPLLAKGGVVDSATLAMIGENGREMVLPLENNLDYLDKLASMLANRIGSGNTPIKLYVDGRVFAETAINTLNQRTQQTGRLDLVLG